MFTFCDVILKDTSIVRGVCINSDSDAEKFYLFHRNPVLKTGLQLDGYVAEIPYSQIEHIRYISAVYIIERISAIALMSAMQHDLIRAEMYKFASRRELVGMEKLIEKLTPAELMVLLTEIEHDKYVAFDGGVVRYVNDETYPIDFNNRKTIGWLLDCYIDSVNKLNETVNIEETEPNLDKYRKVYYEYTYEEIDQLRAESEQ